MDIARRTPLSLALVLSLALGSSGCGAGDDEGDATDQDFYEALVQPEDLEITVQDGAALTATLEQALDGSPGQLRQTVLERVQRTNELVRDLFERMCHTVEEVEPSVKLPTLRGWGPVLKDGVQYRFWMRRIGPARFRYHLQARPEGDEPYVSVMWGVLRRLAPHQGAGRMFLHFDNMRQVKPDYPRQGTAWLHFTNVAPLRGLTLLLHEVASGAEQPLSAAYQFGRGAKLSGFRFLAQADVIGGPAQELLAVRAGWNRSGDGRGDGAVWSGDVAPEDAPLVVHECWLERERVYLDFEPDHPEAADEGTPESCPQLLVEAFATPEANEAAAAAPDQSDDTFTIDDLPAEEEVSEQPPSDG